MKKYLLLVLASCSMMAAQNAPAPPAPAAKPADTAASGAMQAANRLLSEGKLNEAIAAFKTIIEKDPKSDGAQAGLVRGLLRSGRLDDAEAAATAAKGAVPESSMVNAAAGDVAFRLGKFGDAEAAYRSALKLDGQNAGAWAGMGRMYSMVSMRRRAKGAFATAHNLAPDDSEIFYEWFNLLSYDDPGARQRPGERQFRHRYRGRDKRIFQSNRRTGNQTWTRKLDLARHQR